jgi:serine/threonine-protein kinase
MSLLRDEQVIRDTYEVERLLGEGAFAEVYRVRHRFLGRQAMKVFKTAGGTLSDIEEQLSEARLLSRLGNPHIIRVFDANVVDLDHGRCGFFTMEYIAGGSLESFRRNCWAWMVPVETACAIVRQVCLGLAVAHAAVPPIIHRDIKPQNILIDLEVEGPHVRLSDFGLARRADPLTQLASACGTLAFKAPEAFITKDGDSCAGDVWAVGCTFYLLLTNEFPYPESLEAPTPSQRSFGGLVPASRFNPCVDDALDAILARMLALNSHDRYANAQEMLRDLTAWKPCAPRRHAQSNEAASGEAGAECKDLRIAEAYRLARQESQLARAAGLLEAVCQDTPTLREAYEYQIQLWRRGIVM